MDKGLADLLSIVASSDREYEKNYTHISLGDARAKWKILDDQYEVFWRGYCFLIDREEKGFICLAERPTEIMPVIVDFKFKFPPKVNDYYNVKFLLQVVGCYQQALIDCLQISDKRMELTCCVIEAKRPWIELDPTSDNTKVTLMSFRLHFPYCRCESIFASKYIRSRAIQYFREVNAFSLLSHQPLNDWDTITEPVTVFTPVLMYGSTYSPDVPRSTLSYIWGPVEANHLESEEGPEYELDEMFELTHFDMSRGLISNKLFEEIDAPVNFWLPMFLSINYSMEVTRIRQDLPSKSRVSVQMVDSIGIMDESPIDRAKRFAGMISPERLSQENYWIEVGKIFHTLTKGNETGLEAWIEITENIGSEEFTVDDCGRWYSSFNGCYLTEKTLAWYAKEDNRNVYDQWHKGWCQQAVEKALTMTHTDVAEVLYRFYWLEYACGLPSKRRWFVFRNHRWHETDQGIGLKRIISTDFAKVFERYRAQLSTEVHTTADEAKRISLEEKIKILCTLINCLKKQFFKNHILKEAMEHFYDEKFLSLLDSNVNLHGTLNGILETVRDRVIYRPGKPEDFITKCIGARFDASLNEKSPTVVEVDEWLEKIFPESTDRALFWKDLASWLRRGNEDKKVRFWTGETNTGKSSLERMIECVFGPYCIKFPDSVINDRRNGNSPSPELARAQNASCTFIDEIEEGVQIRAGFMKKVSGGDSFFGRFLHDNGGEIKSLFKMIIVCNKIPPINSLNKAVRYRNLIFVFESIWDDNAPTDPQEQKRLRHYKKDRLFEQRIPYLASAFLYRLTTWYPKYMREGLTMTPNIINAIESYWNRIDYYAEFITNHIEEMRHPDNSLDLEHKLFSEEVYVIFKQWFLRNYPTRPLIDISEFREELRIRLARTEKDNVWLGYRLKQGVQETNLGTFSKLVNI